MNRTVSTLALLTLAVLGGASAAQATLVVHGSTTDYQSTDKDWLSHTANDIDGNGLGTDGFVFFGEFEGVAPESGRPFSWRENRLASYVASITPGANFNSVAENFPGYGIIDDADLRNGSDRRSGIAAATAAPGSPGDTVEIINFRLDGLTETVRIGILSGNEGTPAGRWDPTSITLSDGTSSATVGDHDTSPLPISPGGINVGWVFFDVDADGDYTISATRRLANGQPAASIGGFTFDTAVVAVPESSAFLFLGLAGLSAGVLGRRKRHRSQSDQDSPGK